MFSVNAFTPSEPAPLFYAHAPVFHLRVLRNVFAKSLSITLMREVCITAVVGVDLNYFRAKAILALRQCTERTL